MDPEREFRIKEYELLTNDLHHIFREAPTNERWLLLTNGGFWAWILTNQDKVVSPLLLFIPLVICALFYLRMRSYKRKQKIISNYRTIIESEFLKDKIGWEKYYRSASMKKSSFKSYSTLFWTILISGNLIVTAYLLLILIISKAAQDGLPMICDIYSG